MHCALVDVVDSESTADWMVVYEALGPTVMQPEGAEVRLAARTVAAKDNKAERVFIVVVRFVQRLDAAAADGCCQLGISVATSWLDLYMAGTWPLTVRGAPEAVTEVLLSRY